jgi:hypothetical protein
MTSIAFPQPMETPAPATTRPAALAEASAVGAELAVSLRNVLSAIPDAPRGPTALAAHLTVSRVLLSKTLGAITGDDALDTLQRLPGPESLRGIVEAAASAGAPRVHAAAAIRAIDRFAHLIRESFGTRGTLNAAICADAPAMQRRLENDSRQRVFKGMRELRGVEAETWLSASIMVPDRQDPTKLTVMMLQGFLALRRLRLDVPVAFSFETMGVVGAVRDSAVDVPASAIGLEDLYTNRPAPLELAEMGGQKIYRLAQGRIGKHEVSDMLALIHMPKWRPRWSVPERPLTGPFAQPPAPVKALHFDVLLADGIIDGSAPELFAYAPSYRGGANINDRTRDIDRVAVPERVEVVPRGPGRFDIEGVPNYRLMLQRMAESLGQDIDAMRLHRVRIAYPPFGYQFVSTFRLPPSPDGNAGAAVTAP